MKTVPAAFLTMLNSSKSLVMADLYTITLKDGTVLRYTSADIDITYATNTYLSAKSGNAPGLGRGNTRTTIGLSADDLEIDILFDATTRINGVTPASFVAFGGFDNCYIQVHKALAPDWTDPVANGVVSLFEGIVAEASIETGKIALTVNSPLRALNNDFPRNYFLPSCNHSLFDSGCGLSKASYAFSGTVASSPSPTQTTFGSNATQADDYYALGYVIWTSGANTGQVSAVKAYANSGGTFTIIYPLPTAPASGDTFTAYPGCDKTRSTCSAKFGNLQHFRGFPFVPTPEQTTLGGTGGSSAPSSSLAGSIKYPTTGTGGQNSKFSVK